MLGAGKTEWEDILIEKGIIQAPKASIEHHPDIIYDTGNKQDDQERDEIDDIFSDEDDDEFIQKYK
ncbi:hypothetical protein C9890_0553 [Perkinsus sp. BL_2016]|nr:hypothetical protein C9890_0553 [Perkinsus sp. BL_2016]